jgi:hypothetical protein
MAGFVIRIVGLAGRGPSEGFEGKFIKRFSDAGDYAGNITVADTAAGARVFRTKTAAFLYWRQQSKLRPRRPDGQPNRPLTAFTVEILPASDAAAGATVGDCHAVQDHKGNDDPANV